MEEIYKPETEDAGKVEVYSRENNEMLGDMPQWLIHTGSYIVYGLIVFLVAGTALFKYPDTIKKAVTIDDMGSVEWITANQGGMIERFFIENQSQVKRNDTLGILKNTASLEDVQTFCNVLTNIEWYYRTNDINYLQDYPFNLIMGEMAPAYEQFTQAVRTCVMYQEFDLYPQKKKFLDDELKILNESKQANALEILKVKREEFELEINHKMEMGKNRRMLELAYENMVNSLRTWENKYLIKSRHDGIVVWGKSWGMSHRVNEGDTLCTVISKQQANPLGHIRLSQDEVAEVAVGDKVNIELNKYPTHSIYKEYNVFSHLKPTKAQITKVFNQIRPLLTQVSFPVILGKEVTDKNYQDTWGGSRCFKGSECSALTTHMFILPDGKVTVCEQLYWHPQFIIGNVTTQSLKEVWHSPQALHLCSLSRQDINKESPCRECRLFEDCFSYQNRCWSDIIKAYGKDCWDFPDPRCCFAPAMKNKLSYD